MITVEILEELPEKDSSAFAAMDSKHVKALAVYNILQELGGSLASEMTNEECRNSLARCQAHLIYINPEDY